MAHSIGGWFADKARRIGDQPEDEYVEHQAPWDVPQARRASVPSPKVSVQRKSLQQASKQRKPKPAERQRNKTAEKRRKEHRPLPGLPHPPGNGDIRKKSAMGQSAKGVVHPAAAPVSRKRAPKLNFREPRAKTLPTPLSARVSRQRNSQGLSVVPNKQPVQRRPIRVDSLICPACDMRLDSFSNCRCG